MQGLTDHEKALAVAAGDPGTGINLALAELSLYWDNHRRNAPDVHELRINIRVTDDGDDEDRIAAVRSVADWLGVKVHCLHGCYLAQRRFGTGADSIIVEAHYTPDPVGAHFERLAAKEAAGSPEARETAPVLAEVAA